MYPCALYLPNATDSSCFSKKTKSSAKIGGETAEVLLQWLAPKHVTVSACIELRDKDDPQEVEYLKTNHQAIFHASKNHPPITQTGIRHGQFEASANGPRYKETVLS